MATQINLFASSGGSLLPLNEAVKNQLIIHLLQRREDPRQRAGEIVENGEGRKLTCPAFLEDGDDLGELARNPKHTGTALQILQTTHVGDVLVVEGVAGRCKTRNEDRSRGTFTAVL
ncbi:hypothetical protein KC363_g54 [Hortaea werneckii]|nr:hypothetical protein KC363_g54 [Hortaea werneckii]